MISRYLLLILMIAFGLTASAQQPHTLLSPDVKIKVTVTLQDKLTYGVTHENDVVIAPSPISMQLTNGDVLGGKPQLRNAKQNSVNQTIKATVYKRAEIKDHYNELVLNFKGDYAVIFRAYNDGVAYRFATSKKKDFQVQNEEAAFNFPADHTAIVPYVKQEKKTTIEEQFWNFFENTYTHAPLSKLDPERLAFLPLSVEVNPQKKVVITEADLESYPGMYLINQNGKPGLTGVFAAYPKRIEQGGP